MASIEGLRRRYQRIAPFYDLLDLPFEYGRYRRLRPLLFEGISGRILDAGVGTGRNMSFYPKDAEVVGVDLSPAMLRRAARRQQRTSATACLAAMDISRLAVRDAAFDAAVASFVFCTLPEALLITALRELNRVVKPGGRIRLLEYISSDGLWRRTRARLWTPWAYWAYGARLDRRVDAHVVAAGLTVTSQRDVIHDQLRLVEIEATQCRCRRAKA